MPPIMPKPNHAVAPAATARLRNGSNARATPKPFATRNAFHGDR
jgi:hypothetical protein